MIIPVTISDEIIREAHDQGHSVEDYVDILIDKGRSLIVKKGGGVAVAPDLDNVIERIRALRGSGQSGR
jgi:hypothetical protein